MAKGDKHVGEQDLKGNKEQKSELAVTGEKLDLRKKNGTITLVTPPSFFQNQNRSFCLINLSISSFYYLSKRRLIFFNNDKSKIGSRY